MFLRLLMICGFTRITTACLSSGVCGSSCLPAAPIACQPASCQPGYSCGQYGCARNRARSSLTKKIAGVFISENVSDRRGLQLEDKETVTKKPQNERNIYGMLRGGNPSVEPLIPETTHKVPLYDNATRIKLSNPNYIFRQCCEQRGLPDSCLNKCHFNTYTKDALQAMYFKSDGCPLAAAADMQFCAAQGMDHTQCCVRNGVTTTLAGQKCLTFCDQRPDKITKLDYSYVPCYDRFEAMKRCFYNEIKTKAEQQFLN